MGQEEGSSWGYTRGKGVDGRTKGGSGAPVPSCRPLGTQVTEEHPSAQPHLLPSPKDTSVSDQLTPEMAERSAFPPSPHSLFLLWIYDSKTHTSIPGSAVLAGKPCGWQMHQAINPMHTGSKGTAKESRTHGSAVPNHCHWVPQGLRTLHPPGGHPPKHLCSS